MGRQERLPLIRTIQNSRKSRLICYFCGDRKPIGAQINVDAIRPMYDHLRELKFPEKKRRLDLLLYSLGGAMEVPWRVVTMLREFCDEYSVIVPFKAYSATTLIAIGADRILMTNKGELGPIDPSMTLRNVPVAPDRLPPALLGEIGVEDIAAYVSFIKNRAGITDQAALAGVIGTLAQAVTPTLLGRLERTYSHIRLVARKLLSLVQPPLDDATVTTIVEALTEKTYAHGHGIGRLEARQLGLRVEPLDGKIGDAAWNLYLDYEQSLALGDSGDPSLLFTEDGSDKVRQENYAVGYIESESMVHLHSGTLEVQRVRKIPQLNLNLNLSLQLPAGFQPGQLQPPQQQILQQMVQQAVPQVQQLVNEEIRKQAPIERMDVNLKDAKWRLVR